MRLLEIAQAVGAELRKRGVPNMLIGGMAAIAHSGPRTTRDVDLVLFVSPDRAADAVTAVESAGLDVGRRSEAIRRLRKLQPVKVGKIGIYHLDLRIASWSIDRDAFRRVARTIAGGVPLVPPEELVAYKLARGEDIDWTDMNAVIRANPGFDWARMTRATVKLADELGRSAMIDRLQVLMGKFGRR